MADLLGAMSQLDEELTHTAADENKEETAEPAEDDFDKEFCGMVVVCIDSSSHIEF